MKYTALITTLAVTAIGANASVIIAPTSTAVTIEDGVSSPTENATFGFVSALTDGTGFDAAGIAAMQTGEAVPADLPVHSAAVSNGYRWFNTNTATNAVEFTFSLGGAYDLTDVILYNYGEAASLTNRGLNTVDILVSSDGVNFVAAEDNFSFSQADLTDFDGQTQTFTSTLSNVTHVRFNDITNFGGTNDTITGFQEIRFVGTAVPEPSSTALLGLAGLGLLARRKRQA